VLDLRICSLKSGWHKIEVYEVCDRSQATPILTGSGTSPLSTFSYLILFGRLAMNER